ncbi:M56 family metallopeptidase [Pontiellaceae bacterium B1224]|nr:M56 family metallopeptidase [Pontiellaceae bacterium B1224]
MPHFFQAIYHSALTEILATSLLHSLWQATGIGLVYLLFLKCIPTTKSSLRYKLGMLSLLAVLLCWLGTLSILNQQPSERTQSTSPAIASPAPSTTIGSSSKFEMFPMSGTPEIYTEKPLVVEPQKSEPQISIHSILTILWSIGVTLMIIRLFLALTGTQRHRSKALLIEDSTLLKCFQNLCVRLGLKRNIIFAATTTLQSPGVIGILKPIILIPTSMLTGFSSSDLEAVVAHELAHIRRNDYLFNLLQMVIESLFFFNPAVWWISHRIRMEREACCDAMAMDATGQTFEYANLLLNEFGAAPATVPAFGSSKKADAKERLLRIVHPNKKFDVKIGSVRLILLLILTTFGIFALAKTSDLAVETVAKLMTPKERVEKLIELAGQKTELPEKAPEQQVDRHDYASKPRITISGIIRTADSTPLPQNIEIAYISLEKPKSQNWQDKQNAKKFHATTVIDEDGLFSLTNAVALGTQYLSVKCSDFQPIKFQTESPQDITNLELILTRSFSAELIIQNKEGKPIPGASVMLMYIRDTVQDMTYMHDSPEPKTTDSEGRLHYSNQGTNTVVFKVSAKGYQTVDFHLASFNKEQPIIIQLDKGQTVPGRVTDKETGKPVNDAQIIITKREVPTYGFNMDGGIMGMSDDREIGRTDPDGKFLIDTIGSNATFTITVKAPGKNASVVEGITTKTKHIDVQLSPKRIIRGKLIGDLSKIYEANINNIGSHPSISYASSVGGGILIRTTPVTITNGVGHFKISDIQGNFIRLLLTDNDYNNQKQLAEIQFTDRSEYDLTIDLDSDKVEHGPDSRMIEVEITTPPGLPPAEGVLELRYQSEMARKSESYETTDIQIEIVNGRGLVTIPTPSYIGLMSTKGIKGYWIEQGYGARASTNLIQTSSEPLTYSVKAMPAGGIVGNVFNIDGKPSETFETLVIQKSWPKKISHYWSLLSSQRQSESFAITTIPLNETFALIVNKGSEWIITDPLVLTEESAIQNMDLKFGPSKPIQGRILKPDGTPAAHVYIQLLNNIDIAEGFSTYSYADGIMTDANGYFSFGPVSISDKFSYKLRVSNNRFPVEPGSNETYTLKAKK